MGLFDFVGTFFFLSLGITFVLILLLVYHFKQRLTEMEQKSDKMFEIINTIVKEMGNIRRAQANAGQLYMGAATPQAVYSQEVDSDDDAGSEYDTGMMEAIYEMKAEDADADQEDLEEEYEQCAGEDLEEDEETDEKKEEHDVRQEHINKFFNIHEDDYNNDPSDEKVKVVSVDLTYHDEDIRDNISDLEDDFNDQGEDQSAPVLSTPIGEEVIHVNKLEELSVVEEESHSIHEDSHKQVPYSKMTLTQLRAYAVSKGLLSDSSKYKKAELVKLLESSDE